jgi:hypothetical protein
MSAHLGRYPCFAADRDMDDYDALLAHVHESPDDEESWKHLIHVAETSGDIYRISQAYEAFLERHPNTSPAQIAYIGHFIHDPATHGQAEELLGRFLRPSHSLDLWKLYLDYVRRVNSAPTQRETVRKAFDFAISHIGQDRASGSIWAEYIEFLKAAETTSPLETSQKIETIRKVYQRAIEIPLDNIGQLRNGLDDFETAVTMSDSDTLSDSETLPDAPAASEYDALLARLRESPWTASVGKNDEALGILKAGLEANPDRCIVYFTFVPSAYSTIQFCPDLRLC